MRKHLKKKTQILYTTEIMAGEPVIKWKEVVDVNSRGFTYLSGDRGEWGHGGRTNHFDTFAEAKAHLKQTMANRIGDANAMLKKIDALKDTGTPKGGRTIDWVEDDWVPGDA